MDNHDNAPRTTLRKPGRAWGWVALLLCAVLGVAGWFAFLRAQKVEPPAPSAIAPPSQVDAGAFEPQVSLEGVDAVLASSPGFAPDLATWLAEPGLTRRLAAAVWQVSEGESPREPLRFLAPQGGFSVETRAGRTFMAPASAARYDFVASALGSVNAAQAGDFARRNRRFLEAAFREISPPGRRLDAALNQALERLSAVPLSDEPLELVPMEKGVGYAFAAPALERLDPAQKHLLRMGPANARLVVQQLRLFRDAARAP
jgi:hypothetical protein